MSFVDRFYSFLINLSAVERQVYENIRIKVPKYPLEELGDVVMRVLTYTHNWTPDLQFSPTPLDHEQPTLSEFDHAGEARLWLSSGVPDIKALRLAVRRYTDCRFAVYFSSQDQIDRFCHHLRGTRENWVAPIHFYFIAPELLALLVERIQSSNQWDITESEQIFFIDDRGTQLELPFHEIDIWKEYQNSLIKEQSDDHKSPRDRA